MFENLKDMASMAGLLKDLPKLKAKLDEVKTRLGERTVEAQSGGGASTPSTPREPPRCSRRSARAHAPSPA